MSGQGADCRLFFGKSGSGKTTLALAQLAGARRVLIHDPNAEDKLARRALVIHERAELVKAVSIPGRVRICWRGVATMGPEAFEWANRCAWAGEGFTVLWDEVDRFTGSGRLPEHAYLLVNAGRHRRCRVFACTRRPFRMPRDLTAAATRIMAFRITGPTDVAYLAEFMGPAAAARLPELPDFTALDWQEGTVSEKKSPFA
jgi:hypothetical protein